MAAALEVDSIVEWISSLFGGPDIFGGLLRIREQGISSLSDLFSAAGPEFQSSIVQPLEQVIRELESPEMSTWSAESSAAARASVDELRTLVARHVPPLHENYAEQSAMFQDFGIIVAVTVTVLVSVVFIVSVFLLPHSVTPKSHFLSQAGGILRNYQEWIRMVAQRNTKTPMRVRAHPFNMGEIQWRPDPSKIAHGPKIVRGEKLANDLNMKGLGQEQLAAVSDIHAILRRHEKAEGVGEKANFGKLLDELAKDVKVNRHVLITTYVGAEKYLARTQNRMLWGLERNALARELEAHRHRSYEGAQRAGEALSSQFTEKGPAVTPALPASGS